MVLAGLTVLVEKRSANPLLPTRLFRSTSVLGANLLTIVALVPGFGMSVVLSQYSLGVLGHTPIQFGLSQSAMPIASVVGAFAAQAGLARRGVRPVAVTALLLLGAGCALLVGISLDGAYLTTVFPGLVLFGLGLGAGPVALAAAALAGATPADAGIASGTSTAAFQIGGAFGVAVVSTIIASSAAATPGPAGALAGFHQSLVVCAVVAAAGAVLAVVLLKNARGGQIAAVPRVH